MLRVHVGVAVWRQHIGQSRHDEDQAGDVGQTWLFYCVAGDGK